MQTASERRRRPLSWYTERLLWVPVVAALLLGVVLIAFPFVWMVSASFKNGYEMFLVPPKILPMQPTLASYTGLFAAVPFWHYYGNSAFVTVVYATVAMFIGSLTAFALAKYNFRLRNLLLSAVISTIMIPIYSLVIPLYAFISVLGWIDTYAAVIVPFCANGITIFFMRQSMLGIPDELMDAARIDGSTEFGIYRRVALPISKASLVVCAILLATNAWNDFLWPTVVLRSSKLFTIPIALANFVGMYSVDWASVMAGSVLATAPVLILFVALQRHFLAGILAGAVKQ